MDVIIGNTFASNDNQNNNRYDMNETVIIGTENDKSLEQSAKEPSFGAKLGRVAAGFAGGILLGGAATVGTAILTSAAEIDLPEDLSDSEDEAGNDMENAPVAAPRNESQNESQNESANASGNTDDDPVASSEVAHATGVDLSASEVEIQEGPSWVDEAVEIATKVDDGMSFSEAFREARAEVGSGGAFEWRGNVYSTYTAEEWADMSAKQKKEYNDHFDWSRYHSGATPVPESEPELEAELESELVLETELEAFPGVEPEVEFLGLDIDLTTDSLVGELAVDGNEVYLIDVDPVPGGDNQFDIMVADVDGNGVLTEDEILDISDQGLSVEEFASMTSDSGELYAAGNDVESSEDGGYMYI